jgi:hypothetical protein
MVINLLSGEGKRNHDIFEQMSQATNKFTEVDMKISINGVDIPVDYLVEAVKSNMTYWAEKEAARIVSEYEPLAKFREISEKIEQDLSAARYSLRFHLDDLISGLGIEPPDYGD